MNQLAALSAQIATFCAAHAGALSLLGLAFVVTMREALPSPFDRVAVFVWIYGWLHDALKTWVSFRAPAPPPAPKKENT